MQPIILVSEVKKLLKKKGSKVCIDTSGEGNWIFLEKSDWISRVCKRKYFVDYDGNPLNLPSWDEESMVMYIQPYTSTSDEVDIKEWEEINKRS